MTRRDSVRAARTRSLLETGLYITGSWRLPVDSPQLAVLLVRLPHQQKLDHVEALRALVDLHFLDIIQAVVLSSQAISQERSSAHKDEVYTSQDRDKLCR